MAADVRRNRSAFTLIEAVATLLILGVVGAGMAAALADYADMYSLAARRARLHNLAWIALERAAAELSLAGEGEEAVTVPSRGASASELVFSRPSAAGCAACVDHSTQVAFRHTPADHTLWRDTAQAPMAPLAQGVTAFTVSASDDPAPSRRYTLTITLAHDPLAPADGSVSMTTTVFPLAAARGASRVIQ